jgi:hypothetical protein
VHDVRLESALAKLLLFFGIVDKVLYLKVPVLLFIQSVVYVFRTLPPVVLLVVPVLLVYKVILYRLFSDEEVTFEFFGFVLLTFLNELLS